MKDSFHTLPVNDAVVEILSQFAARESATVEEVLALARQLPAVLGQGGGQTNFAEIATPPAQEASSTRPAVAIEKSWNDETVTCLCCGRRFTMLKRHITAEHSLTEDQYRATFKLADDHPLVAPSYSLRKAEYAKRIGLGKYTRDETPDRGVASPS